MADQEAASRKFERIMDLIQAYDAATNAKLCLVVLADEDGESSVQGTIDSPVIVKALRELADNLEASIEEEEGGSRGRE